MIPAYWYDALPSFLWQVVLHGSVTGVIFYLWVRSVRLGSGSAKRSLLVILLLLPVATAAVPGRANIDFRGLTAWFDSGRVLAIPLVADLRLYHVALVVGLLTILVTLWQEVLPAFRRSPLTTGPAPESVGKMASGLPGWERCGVILNPSAEILVATSGWPGRPVLIVSEGARDRLTEDELAMVVRHEHAHWTGGRWTTSHALFGLRLLQCYNPIALWVFREYCLEVEIACDADALAGRDPKALARVLLRLYESTNRRDVAARSALRKRVDVLLERPPGSEVLSVPAIGAATLILLVVLPWVV